MIYVIIFVIVIDQLSKVLALKYLPHNYSYPVINNIFHLTLVKNTGAAFGILKNQLPLFIVTSILAIILIYLNIKKNRSFGVVNFSLAFIFAGAVGNLIDRLRFGCVIDFLDFRIWPVFNVADTAITIGALILGWQILFNSKRVNF